MQKNEEERDKAGDEEEQFMMEHDRWQKWASTLIFAYEALAEAAIELARRNRVLVDVSKSSLIADGMPEDFVKNMPGVFVPLDQGLQAQESVLRHMESFRDVSYGDPHSCILAVFCACLYSCTLQLLACCTP